MSDKPLSEFGGGVPPEKRDSQQAHDSRGERSAHRRQQYRLGRCRGISTAKGCRCGAGVIEDTDGQFCEYHGKAQRPVTIDDKAGVLVRWCGLQSTAWEEIPVKVQRAVLTIDPTADEGEPA